MTYEEADKLIWHLYQTSPAWEWLDSNGTFKRACHFEAVVSTGAYYTVLNKRVSPAFIDAILDHAVRLEQEETSGLV